MVDGAATARSLWLPKRLLRDHVMVRSTTTSRSVSITVEKIGGGKAGNLRGADGGVLQAGNGQRPGDHAVRAQKPQQHRRGLRAPGLAMPIVVSKNDDDEPSAR